MGNSVNRRQFLGRTAASGMVLAGGLAARPLRAGAGTGLPKMRPARIHKVYLGDSGGAWPGPTFDAAAEIARYENYLSGVERRLGDVKFVGGQQVRSADEAAKLAANLGDADGLLLLQLNFSAGERAKPLVDTGRPTVMFVYPFSGHQWMYFSQWKRAGKKVVLLPTSDYSEIERAVALLRVPSRMRQTRIIQVGALRGTAAACSAERIKERLGAEVITIGNQEIIEAHAAVDLKAAEAEADRYWISQANEVVEPTREKIVNSARLYLAVRDLMIKQRAQAITSSHCMGAPAKCCLTFSKLNDLGLVGACEGDIDSTLTMLVFAYAFGVPGFISDPLFDTSKNSVIHAHCTSVTKLDGPGGKRAPFLIRTQCDSNAGVSLEVQMRVGQEITCAKLVNLDTMLISTGKITEIPNYEDRGCRTQITTRVADARKMVDNWGGGVLEQEGMMTLLHRVVFYGNRLQDVRDLGTLMGMKVVDEA